MKFYDVHNKGGKSAKSHFIIAKDEKDAFRIAATQPGTPMSLNELPNECNIPKLLESGQTGILAKKISMMSFTDIMEKRESKKIEEPWFFTKII
jgi:hypothetical protein